MSQRNTLVTHYMNNIFSQSKGLSPLLTKFAKHNKSLFVKGTIDWELTILYAG